MSSPVILVIPGSFTTAQMYYATLSAISKFNPSLETYVSNLPSAIRNPPEQPATLSDDVAHFTALIEKLADEDKDIVLVAHSYGGLVATEIKGESKSERESTGKKGGVVRIVYLAAHVPEVGKSLQDQVGEPPAAMISVGEDHYIRFVDVETIARGTFPDQDLPLAIQNVSSMGRHSNLSFTSKVTHAGWKDVPISWILCEQDYIIAPDVQKAYVKRIEEESGKKVDLYSIATGHAPNATSPDKLAEVLVEIVRKGV